MSVEQLRSFTTHLAAKSIVLASSRCNIADPAEWQFNVGDIVPPWSLRVVNSQKGIGQEILTYCIDRFGSLVDCQGTKIQTCPAFSTRYNSLGGHIIIELRKNDAGQCMSLSFRDYRSQFCLSKTTVFYMHPTQLQRIDLDNQGGITNDFIMKGDAAKLRVISIVLARSYAISRLIQSTEGVDLSLGMSNGKAS